MEFSLPFNVSVDDDGLLSGSTSHVKRSLKDMRAMYAAGSSDTAQDDLLIYEVSQRDVPSIAGELVVCTTILRPGHIGDEYFMTKGHFHSCRERAEVYFGLHGSGIVLVETEGDEVQCEALTIEPGQVVYVPPLWGHRTVNTGSEPLVFLAVYPADAGHDYEAIEKEGFHQRVIEHEGRPLVIHRDERSADQDRGRAEERPSA